MLIDQTINSIHAVFDNKLIGIGCVRLKQNLRAFTEGFAVGIGIGFLPAVVLFWVM